jgi:hypothetical protein
MKKQTTKKLRLGKIKISSLSNANLGIGKGEVRPTVNRRCPPPISLTWEPGCC